MSNLVKNINDSYYLRQQQKSHRGLWILQQSKFCLLKKIGYLLWK